MQGKLMAGTERLKSICCIVFSLHGEGNRDHVPFYGYRHIVTANIDGRSNAS